MAKVLDRLDRAITELHEASKVAHRLARTQAQQLAAKDADDDEWTRMPRKGHRCAITGWTGRNINKHHAAGRIRKKTIHGSAFYSGADARRLIRDAT